MHTIAEYPGEHGPAWLVSFRTLDEELRFLRSLVDRFRADPAIRERAMTIIRDAGIPSRDKRGQALAIASWVRSNVYYVHELPERFQWPTETIRARAGDCDDFATLTASLLEAIGIRSLLVTMQIDGRWAHIFTAAALPTGVLPLDASNRFGVERNPVRHAEERGKKVRLKLA